MKKPKGRIPKTGGRGGSKAKSKLKVEKEALEEEVVVEVKKRVQKRQRQATPGPSSTSMSKTKVKASEIDDESEAVDSELPPCQDQGTKRKRRPRVKPAPMVCLAYSDSDSDLTESPTDDAHHDDDEKVGAGEDDKKKAKGRKEGESSIHIDIPHHPDFAHLDRPPPINYSRKDRAAAKCKDQDNKFVSGLSALRAKREILRRSAGIPSRFQDYLVDSWSPASDSSSTSTPISTPVTAAQVEGVARKKKRVRIDEGLNEIRIIPTPSPVPEEHLTTASSPQEHPTHGLPESIKALRYASQPPAGSAKTRVADTEFELSSDSDSDRDADSGADQVSSPPTDLANTATLGPGDLDNDDREKHPELETAPVALTEEVEATSSENLVLATSLDSLRLAIHAVEATEVPTSSLESGVAPAPVIDVDGEIKGRSDLPPARTQQLEETPLRTTGEIVTLTASPGAGQVPESGSSTGTGTLTGTDTGTKTAIGTKGISACWHPSQEVMHIEEIVKFVKEWQEPQFHFDKVSPASLPSDLFLLPSFHSFNSYQSSASSLSGAVGNMGRWKLLLMRMVHPRESSVCDGIGRNCKIGLPDPMGGFRGDVLYSASPSSGPDHIPLSYFPQHSQSCTSTCHFISRRWYLLVDNSDVQTGNHNPICRRFDTHPCNKLGGQLEPRSDAGIEAAINGGCGGTRPGYGGAAR